MNVFDGKRKVIYEKQGRFEAQTGCPTEKSFCSTWTDYCIKYLLTGEILRNSIPDSANRNNNDHGISFNGKLLAIS